MPKCARCHQIIERTSPWQIVVPLDATAGGLAAALAVGAMAGLYPALRAARVSPTDALRST